MQNRILIILTILVSVAVAISINLLDPERLSALGSIVSGAGGLLAVIWFSAGLRYQSKQLEEQRQQFAAQFQHLQENSRRDALLLAKGILDKAEADAVAQHGSISSLNQLFTECANFAEFKTILESTSPHEVMRAYQSWIKKEGAAITLLNGVKSAAIVYLRSVDITDFDTSKTPEEFYLMYGERFSSQPFFNAISGTAMLLSELMTRLLPGRRGALIAYLAANSKAFSKEIIKQDKLRADMAQHQAEGFTLPAIARDI